MSSFGYTPPSRDSIYQALFALASGATISGKPAFKATSRGIRSWSQVATEEKPALYQFQVEESLRRNTGSGMPYVDRMLVELYIVVGQQDDSQPSSPLLNPLVDAVIAALQPSTTAELQTLGGLVYDVRLSGKIEYREGMLGTTNAFAVIPVEILTGGLQPD